MSLEWEGVGARGVFKSEIEQQRDRLADAAHSGSWNEVMVIVRRAPALANAVRLGGRSGFAPLHQIAWQGGPISIAAGLVGFGAWRTLRSASGERPLDVARRRGHVDDQFMQLLGPVIGCGVPAPVLAALEMGFHEVIRGRAQREVESARMRLPQLAPMLERGCEGRWWFPVPGMYGGFSYWLERDGPDALLVSESWCRVVGGSGERHEIDRHGSRLTASGFA